MTVPVSIGKILQPDESIRVQTPLSFVAVADVDGVIFGNPVLDTGRIHTGGYVDGAGIHRAFGSAEELTPFQVKFPVKISVVSGNRSLAPGESTQVSFIVENVSSQDIGNEASIARALQATFNTVAAEGAELTIDDVIFTTSDGQTIPLHQVFETQLANLAAGQSREIKGKIELKPRTNKPYAHMEFRAGLHLGRLADRMNAALIQEQEFRLQVVRKFTKHMKPGLVLITNDRTTRQEISHWEKLAKEMNLAFADYNISYYGSLSLYESDLSGISDCTVIIPNHPYNPVIGDHLPADLLEYQNTMLFLREKNVNVYIVGDRSSGTDIPARIESYLGDPVNQFDSFGAYRNGLARGRAATSNVTSTADGDEIEVRTRWAFGTPSEKWLHEVTQTEQQRLMLNYPNVRLIFSIQYDPIARRPFKDFLRSRKVGVVKVFRADDLNSGHFSFMPVDPKQIQTEEFISGPNNVFGVIDSLTFRQKLERFDAMEKGLITHATVYGRALYDSIMLELMREQESLRFRNWGFLSRDTIRSSLPNLTELMNFEFSDKVRNSSTLTEMLMDIAADFQHAIETSRSKWRFVWPLNHFRPNEKVSSVSLAMIQNFAKSVFKDEADKILQRVELRRKHLEQLEKETEKRISKTQAIHAHLESPILPEAGLATDRRILSPVTDWNITTETRRTEVKEAVTTRDSAIRELADASQVARAQNADPRLASSVTPSSGSFKGCIQAVPRLLTALKRTPQ